MDAKWPRASEWLKDGKQGELGIIGIPAYKTSISPTQAHYTPTSIRLALAKYSSYSVQWRRGLENQSFVNFGDVKDPDANENRTIFAVSEAVASTSLLIALGGDNSITYAVALGAQADAVITFDAHHDVRDGISNGSPIRRLIESGIPGNRIVQIGIADFANSEIYSNWAKDQGIHVITRDRVAEIGISSAVSEALACLDGAVRIHVDVDVDVCDRSAVPACPASLPGGLSAAELRKGVQLVAADPRVRTIDITEIDAAADTPDQRTIRLGALLILEAALGHSLR